MTAKKQTQTPAAATKADAKVVGQTETKATAGKPAEPKAPVVDPKAGKTPAPKTEPKAEVHTVPMIMTQIKLLGVETNAQVITKSEELGLISKNMSSTSDAKFFQKSYGSRARKLHLRDYAPSYTIKEFVEVGLDYHASAKWRPFPNLLSYALLGMAVLTGREPKMPNGIYTNCGKSFAKHSNEEGFAWAEWFKANEHVRGAQLKATKLAEAEAARLIQAATAAKQVKAEKPKADAKVTAETKPAAKKGKTVTQQEAA